MVREIAPLTVDHVILIQPRHATRSTTLLGEKVHLARAPAMTRVTTSLYGLEKSLYRSA